MENTTYSAKMNLMKVLKFAILAAFLLMTISGIADVVFQSVSLSDRGEFWLTMGLIAGACFILLPAFNKLFLGQNIPKKPEQYICRKYVFLRLYRVPFFSFTIAIWFPFTINIFCAAYCTKEKLYIQNLIERDAYNLDDIQRVTQCLNVLCFKTNKTKAVILTFYTPHACEEFRQCLQNLIKKKV